jgi:hypothetical protein
VALQHRYLIAVTCPECKTVFCPRILGDSLGPARSPLVPAETSPGDPLKPVPMPLAPGELSLDVRLLADCPACRALVTASQGRHRSQQVHAATAARSFLTSHKARGRFGAAGRPPIDPSLTSVLTTTGAPLCD